MPRDSTLKLRSDVIGNLHYTHPRHLGAAPSGLALLAPRVPLIQAPLPFLPSHEICHAVMPRCGHASFGDASSQSPSRYRVNKLSNRTPYHTAPRVSGDDLS